MIVPGAVRVCLLLGLTLCCHGDLGPSLTNPQSLTPAAPPEAFSTPVALGSPPLPSRLILRGGGKEEPILCKLKKGGIHFEILCLPGMVEKFRDGEASADQVLVTTEIFKDCKTGDRHAMADIEKAFEHTDVDKAIEEMLHKGDFQLTVAERKKKTEEKQAQIVTFITKNFMQAGSTTSVPAERVNNALSTIKGLKIDPFRSAESQALELVKKFGTTLPLVKNEVDGIVTVPIAHSGQVSGALRKVCRIRKETFGDEDVKYEISWLTNDYERLVEALTKSTKGQFELKTEGGDAGSSTGAPSPGDGGGKGKGKKGKKKG